MPTPKKAALSTRCFCLLLGQSALTIATLVTGLALLTRPEAPFFHAFAIPLLLLFLAFCALGFFVYRTVYRPYRRVQQVFRRFVSGTTVEELFSLPDALTPDMPGVLETLAQLLDKQSQLKNAMKQAEYLALQNQINPHFLYNTLEAIRGDSLLSGMENIASVVESLSVYFRYTISKVNQLVTLDDELRNVESYFAIQKYRYGDRVHMQVLFDSEDEGLLQCHMPKLTLQPIVENAITHGLEPKVGRGHIRIRFEGTKSRLLITISDDGVGVERAALKGLQDRLRHASPDYEESGGARGGIALVNVNNRLRLLFGEAYGLTMTSTPGLGTDVTITLPRALPDAFGEAFP